MGKEEEIEVGDRVQAKVDIDGSKYNKGDTISGILEAAGWAVDDDKIKTSVYRSSLKLLSKGEDNMGDITKFTVRAEDKALLTGFQELAFKYGVGWSGSGYNQKDTDSPIGVDLNEMIIGESCSNYGQKTYDLPACWDQVKNLLEDTRAPSLGGHEAELRDNKHEKPAVELGCWSGNYNDLVRFAELANRNNIKGGFISLQTSQGMEEVGMTELLEFIEELREFKKRSDH